MKLIRFFILVLSILTVYLLTGILEKWFMQYRSGFPPVRATLTGMGVIVIVMYPLFSKLNDWVTLFAKKIMHSGKRLAGRTLGAILVFLIGFGVLLFFYLRMWYGVNLLDLLFPH